MAPPIDSRRQKMRTLYKFGFVGVICLIFILVIVLTSILSTDGSSKAGNTDSSTYDQHRKFSCYFACDNPNYRNESLPAEETPSLESIYNKKIRAAFQNTTLQPYLDGIDFLGIDENDNHSVAKINAILTFINSSKAEQFLNASFIADTLRTNVDCAQKETVNVTEIEEPTKVTTQAPVPENTSTISPISAETTLPPPTKNYSVYPLLPFCNGHGWTDTCYPNYLGYKTPEEATASLSFFQIMTQQNCHHHIQYFSCALLQPPCSRTKGRIPICKPFCEGVKSSCWELLRLTEIGRKDLCSLENANYGPQCSQICSSSDFICAKTKMCIDEKRRCDAKLDCGPGDLSDELNCTCKSNQFRCSNGMCIKSSLRCNNVNDCGEWEDEIGCTCREGWKNCSQTGQCFPSSAWCDQKFDCADQSDETECLCAPHQFKCQNGLCRPALDRCNGVNDCGDFSDEFDCTCEADQFLCDKHLCKYYATDWCNGKKNCADGTDEPDKCQCKPGQYKCDDGTCIPEHRACDRSIDCPDGSDERHCKCSSLEFECEPGYCIPLEQVCDGVEQCPNKADELQNCECPMPTHFRCNNGQCLPLTRYCNFVSDCPDKEDEVENCNRICPAGYALKCILRKNSEYACLPADKICDGVPDCDQKEDEKNCGECRKDQFRCNDGTCLPLSAYCNGVHDCVDLSDEGNCTCNPAFQFSCDDGWCYMKEQRCDGIAQCADLSDEAQCSCAELLAKQHPERICDQVADCQDLSDEQNCGARSIYTSANAFICYAGRAIDVSKVCDGKKDCPLGDDERHCATLVANVTEDLNRYWEFRDTGTVYFRRNGVWAPVCALANNTETLIVTAQHVCAQNLYQTVASIAMVAWNRTEAMYMPLSKYTSGQTLAPASRECDSGQVLYVKCSHQTCGDNPYNLGEKSNVALLGSRTNTLPFFVSIYSDQIHRCAGNLLGKMWVLTTASCLDGTNEKTLTVRVSVQRNSSLSPYDQFSPVSHQLKHSMYAGRPGGTNDIALLRLAVPLKSTPMAQPICLESLDTIADDIRSTKGKTTTMFTLGMGRLRRKKITADYPDLGEITITNASSCRQHRTVRLERLNIGDEQFCAFEQPDTYRCQAELGSPILKKHSDNQWHLIGLTSRPHSCTSFKYPSIYMNITHYTKWIEHAADVLHAQKPYMRRCDNGMFACLLGNCIDASAICDGVRNCAFGEDEKCEVTLTKDDMTFRVKPSSQLT
ncbi:Low-density lipoprotein receptor domain class A [Trichuris suis]|nr:Low-density lipoprotein receptor domain class A [Trichuris suis]